jgi:hypothetical protein
MVLSTPGREAIMAASLGAVSLGRLCLGQCSAQIVEFAVGLAELPICKAEPSDQGTQMQDGCFCNPCGPCHRRRAQDAKRCFSTDLADAVLLDIMQGREQATTWTARFKLLLARPLLDLQRRAIVIDRKPDSVTHSEGNTFRTL